MSVNSSSSSNTSLPTSPLSSSVNIFNLLLSCLKSSGGAFTFTAYVITSVLFLLPLCILILYLGFQRWRQQHSGTMMSHSDLITYNMIGIELMSILGSTLIFSDFQEILALGLYLSMLNLNGQMLFHLLNCVKCYLAVVHPVTYLSLRKAKGIRIRNITIGCAWLICIAASSFTFLADEVFINILFYCFIAFAITVVCFCSLSVLHVLIRPGPGEGGGDTQRVDQSKLRAFYTIIAILGVLLFRFGGSLFVLGMYNSPRLGSNEKCAIQISVVWFSLPSSLVLPLLYLQRAGKLVCCKNNKASGPRSD